MNNKRGAIKDVLSGTFAAVILLLSLGLTGCDNDTGTAAHNISPRGAAIEKAEAWEKKRYEDILTQKDIPLYSYRIINEFDHDETSFTEGMTVKDGVLYESAGLWDQSRLVAIDIWTGGGSKGDMTWHPSILQRASPSSEMKSFS